MIRKIRLITGLILFTYVLTHLINHSLGIFSLQMMEDMRPIFQGLWANSFGRALLFASMFLHICLAFYALYQRRSLTSMTMTDIVQMVFGLSIPPMILLHIIGTAYIAEFYESKPSYPWLMLIFWKYDVGLGFRQAAVIILAWTHGCIGLYHWLNIRPWWDRYRFHCFAIALLIPILALIGYLQAGKEIDMQAEDFTWVTKVFREAQAPSNSIIANLYEWHDDLIIGFFALILATLALRWSRQLWDRRHGRVTIAYDDGSKITFNQGLSLLDASRQHKRPHASVCGGRGRCSTCRVRVRHGLELLPQASPEEQKVLDRIKAEHDIRLACQCIPKKGKLEITPLLPATASKKDGFARPRYLTGKEMNIAILFADLRGFTSLSENKLPYDVVFLLNRYCHAMGTAVEDAGGHLDKFIGDGVMALFGVGKSEEQGCQEALKAAILMGERLNSLNEGLIADLDQPLRIGIGIHFGPAIVGEMGYGTANQLTAVGDTVNTASRLEGLTKEHGVQLIVSKDFFDAAKVTCTDFPNISVALRGKQTELQAHLIDHSANLVDHCSISEQKDITAVS